MLTHLSKWFLIKYYSNGYCCVFPDCSILPFSTPPHFNLVFIKADESDLNAWITNN